MKLTLLIVMVAVSWLSTAASQCPLASFPHDTLFPSNGVTGDRFGLSADFDGGTAVVGAPHHAEGFSRSGAAYVYEAGPGGWAEVKILVASTAGPIHQFGTSVSIDGDRIAVGAPTAGLQNVDGRVYLFERDAGGPGNWGEVAQVAGSDSQTFLFGWAVALQGDTLVVGAHGSYTNAGLAYVFVRAPDSAAWDEVAVLAPTNSSAFDDFGIDVALDGDTVVVGAPHHLSSTSGPGSAFIYQRDLGGVEAWGRVRRIRGSDVAGSGAFGSLVSISGSNILVGAPDHRHAGAILTGGAFVFERDLGGPDNWGERMELQPNATQWPFGANVAIDEDTIVVAALDPTFSAPMENTLHVFEHNAGGVAPWRETGVLVRNANGELGLGLALSGTTLLAGDPTGTGAASAYSIELTQTFVEYCTAGTTSNGCQPAMSACGTSSATAASGFALQVAGAEPAKPGLFYTGTNGRQANPWGNSTSYECVIPPVKRGPLQTTSGSAATCGGAAFLDLNARWTANPLQNPGAGAVVQAQFWSRDPANTSNQTTALSDGIEFVAGP